MPQVIFAPAAIRDLQRLRASAAIRQGVTMLGTYPRLGRLVDDLPEEFREWLIDYGDSGYVVRYRISDTTVTVLAIRHQKEAGYF